MENASKALMIAAAILIVLLLISFAVLIINRFNPGNLFGNKDRMWAIQAFNDQFTPYETMSGETISGQQVKTLIETVRSNNVTNSDHKVWWGSVDGTEEPTYTVNGRYTTTMHRATTDGYIDFITVTPVAK